MSNLFNAPCIFCGYSGEGYWQAGTHNKDCPCHKVGGRLERETLIDSRKYIETTRKELEKH